MTQHEINALLTFENNGKEFSRYEALTFLLIRISKNPLETSVNKLAREWKWSRDKVTNFLNTLVNMSIVAFLTKSAENQQKICNKIGIIIYSLSTSCDASSATKSAENQQKICNIKESDKENLLPSPTPSSIIKEINKEKIRKTNSNKLEIGKKTKRVMSPEEIEEERKKREDAFYDSLVPYLAQYGKEMLREFYDYWSEWDKDYKSMRFEDQKKWEVSKRLATWYSKLRNRKWKETY